jgi:hypothetical protein
VSLWNLLLGRRLASDETKEEQIGSLTGGQP